WIDPTITFVGRLDVKIRLRLSKAAHGGSVTVDPHDELTCRLARDQEELMTIWFWLALASNAIVWSIFFYLLSRCRWNVAALIVGILHMLFSLVVSVAPFRSFLDPNYPGLGLGFLRFEGMAATLPATLIFGWAVAAAWLAVSKGRGRWMTLIVVGDIFLAINFGGSTLLE